MTSPAPPTADLLRALAPLEESVAALERDAGLVAWWGATDVLPGVGGLVHPTGAAYRLLLVGDATMLRNRVTRQDLYRTGVSALRRMLAGLLLDDLALTPTWAADVVLPRADEDRLTAWMRAHLRLTWSVRADRRERLPEVVEALGPGLDPGRDPGRAALDRYTAAAGERGDRVVGAPFRRP